MTELAGFTRRAAETRLPTRYGDFLAVGYQDPTSAIEHMALVYGDITGRDPLTRVHSECLTGDVFASTRCECGDQLSAAMKAIVAEGAGILIYLQGHEGRGIGLLAKLKAMRLQEDGLDTVDANVALGLPVDCRDYQAAADILQDLGVPAIRLLSNNPHKVESLSQYGIRISEQVPLLIDVNDDNLPYLKAKRERLDHYLPQLDDLL
ncbi:GTP cyclohydrolase II [Kibdelosporangium aridum]|uniref:GTP cyclohydrolase-2 n=1 Tax=Kibdelosporangium aridum TaxID=2030 RepID=A0A1W2F6P7_KIBAR|nr:GTP cyclohydrolase II [Kibdelosporangium aridum]RSM77301.1 GTP cyclohydrolase II [Kibdelosporangium aridum]SMD17610.1 3,4-dihydroxy 2-butanone 4-phosphate synthase / GTP cyclohydrolase II [Kibdelosporangium aridum]